MPEQMPGRRRSQLATKAVIHGNPATEQGFTGIAFKSAQTAPAAPNQTNATAAKVIAIGEEFVLGMGGNVQVLTSLLPGGAAVGDALYIVKATNALALAATALTTGALNATHLKYGRIDDIDTTAGRAHVNLDERGVLPG